MMICCSRAAASKSLMKCARKASGPPLKLATATVVPLGLTPGRRATLDGSSPGACGAGDETRLSTQPASINTERSAKAPCKTRRGWRCDFRARARKCVFRPGCPIPPRRDFRRLGAFSAKASLSDQMRHEQGQELNRIRGEVQRRGIVADPADFAEKLSSTLSPQQRLA